MSRMRMTVVTLPLDVKRAALAEAQERDTNLNDVIVEKLAARFGIEFEPTGRWSSREPNPDQGVFNMRLPTPLYRKLRNAAMPPATMTSVVTDVLRDSYPQAA